MGERSGGAGRSFVSVPAPDDAPVDAQLWHACAGSKALAPQVGAKVIYFPQGHAEQASPPPDLPRFACAIACKVLRLDFLADKETDEAYARMRLQPAGPWLDDDGDDGVHEPPFLPEKPASFAKTLTQSDANNGGGFSIPRYCAETIFPRLDHTQDPPVQTVLAKDVHGAVWKFRHIYRGTPRRHLLTTGWSNFVNHKKLVAGDVIVFMRTATGELCIGVRRSTKGTGHHRPSPRCALKSAENPFSFVGGICTAPTQNMVVGSGNPSFTRNRAPVTAQSVVEAAAAAASGQPFEVVYYPRATTSEFCVKARLVKTALQHSWAPGMRFKMAIETEDVSRTSWYMGTILKVQDMDPIHWPNSPWKMLQVTWDEGVLQGIARVSPWQVELVSPMLLPPLSLSKKKARLSQPQGFQIDGQGIPTALVSNMSGHTISWHGCATNVCPGMEGTRHGHNHGLAVQGFPPSNYQPGLLLDSFYQHQGHHPAGAGGPMVSVELNMGIVPSEVPTSTQNDHLTTLTVGSSSNSEPASSSNISCYDKGGSSSSKRTHFLLFGTAIDTSQSERAQPPPLLSGESSSDGQGLETFSDGNQSEVFLSAQGNCLETPSLSLQQGSLSLQQGESLSLDSTSNEVGTLNWFREQAGFLDKGESP